MKIIKPIKIDPSAITSNTVEVHLAWVSTTTYAEGTRVIYNSKIYESLVNGNLNKLPSTAVTDWILVGPSNATAAFDTSYSTQTTGTNNISFSIVGTEIINSIALLNLDAPSKTLEIRMFDSASNLVYSKFSDLDGTELVDWFDYFFLEFDPLQDVVYLDVPPYSEYTLEIEIDGTGEIRVGAILLGNSQSIGFTQYGVSFGIKDYSLKEENDFGDIVFTERNYAKRLEPSVDVRNSDLSKVVKFLTSVRSVPTVFIPSDAAEFNSLITYGFLADWTVDVTYPQHSLLRMEIKGLT